MSEVDIVQGRKPQEIKWESQSEEEKYLAAALIFVLSAPDAFGHREDAKEML